MKFSISILFLLTVFGAIESAIFRRLEWPMLVTVGLCLVLFWVHWQNRLSQSTNSISKDAINWVTALCVGAAICYVLAAETDSTGKLRERDPQSVSANSVLILATLLLSSSLVHVPKRSFKPLRVTGSIVIVLVFIICMAQISSPVFWYVYMACRGIENASLDPHRVLGEARVMLYSSAAIKATLGVAGWLAWILVAIFSLRKVQKRTSSLFGDVWIACGLGCLATYFEWRCLLDDFPELQASLSVVYYATYDYNLFLILVLGVAGYLQYCMIERPVEQLDTCQDQAWRNRLLGVAMMLPALLFLGEKAIDHSLFSMGWPGWTLFQPIMMILIAGELLTNERLMLLALLLLGLRVVANAKNGPAKFVPLPAALLLQLFLIGCIVIVVVPLHFAASQFYFDAVMMLDPRY